MCPFERATPAHTHRHTVAVHSHTHTHTHTRARTPTSRRDTLSGQRARARGTHTHTHSLVRPQAAAGRVALTWSAWLACVFGRATVRRVTVFVRVCVTSSCVARAFKPPLTHAGACDSSSSVSDSCRMRAAAAAAAVRACCVITAHAEWPPGTSQAAACVTGTARAARCHGDIVSACTRQRSPDVSAGHERGWCAARASTWTERVVPEGERGAAVDDERRGSGHVL